jgi:hypothetical protein
MKTILISILCLSLYVAAEVEAPFIAGVPGDRSKCAVSDGTYLYQGTYTDNAKIVKSRLDNLERVGELIINDAQLLCPSAIVDRNLFFFAYKNDQNAIVKADTDLTTFTTTAVNIDAKSNGIQNVVGSGDSLFVFYASSYGTKVARVKQSDLSLVDTVSIASSALSGVVADATNGDVAVLVYPTLVGETIIRFALASMTTIDSRSVPLTNVQAHAVKGNYLFLGVQSAVYRYDLDTLGNQQSITNGIGSNTAMIVDTDVHIYHRYFVDGLHPTLCKYVRATQEPFQLKDSSAYVINNVQARPPSFLNVFNDVTYFQYTTNVYPKPYIPVLVRIELDSTPKESFVYQQQGSESLSRADIAQNSLIMTGSVGIMKVPLDGSAYSYAALPDGKTFTSNGNREAAIISADETFGYYVVRGGVVKINLSNMTVAESKTVAFTSSMWTDAAVQSGNNLYFYYVQRGVESSIIRYEYNSGASTSPVVLSSNGRMFTDIYDTAASADGQYLYIGTKSGADGKLWMIRFNFNSNTVDQVTELVGTYQVDGVAMDNLGQSLVVTTNDRTFKIDAATLAISASVNVTYQNTEIQFEKSNQFAYIGGNHIFKFKVFKIDLASFTVVEAYKVTRASSSRGAYDKRTDTVYMVGYSSHFFESGLSSNIGYINSSGSSISGDNNAIQSSSATRAFSVLGVVVAALVIFL